MFWKPVALFFKKKDELPTLGQHHEHNTRNKNKMETVLHHTSRFEKKPTYAGIQLFERIPEHIRMEATYKKFRTSLKTHLLKRCLYKVDDL